MLLMFYINNKTRVLWIAHSIRANIQFNRAFLKRFKAIGLTKSLKSNNRISSLVEMGILKDKVLCNNYKIKLFHRLTVAKALLELPARWEYPARIY